ncbi:hypothetical protein NI389_00935 [Pseudoalteromonas xiamenensis]|uniref:hypothetical protein n=1 Tax=Pseudoalteromonas xiamenensis TaxID=882626 RepID=UPI0027E5732E|nr:hypothetical protein [Pseudoalteromonas xiamenensis]WMN60025.1 hypothetical protein NI389_00935 [Pseudoalteromonas xiamenensis]
MKKTHPRSLLAALISSSLLLSGCQSEPTLSQSLTSNETMLSVPTPKQMNADITVAGRVSTLNHIDIQYLGKTIPYTYSEGKITNSRGYNWWVSKHFALKSDLPEEKVKLYLELLELSYPHYVALFGAEPSNIDNQRIAVVYGSTRARVKEAMLDDGFLRGVHDTAGGETMFYNRAGYNFPSHRYHHQRYIVIHETMHAFHMALTGHSSWAPNWITEGLADSIAHHVYDPDKKQLNVMVFDRAPMNYLITGLKQYYAANKPTIEQINDSPRLERGLNFFIIHFLLNDPERALYFQHFMRRLMAANPHSENTLPVANKLLKETFPNWHKVEEEFAQFVSNVAPTFNIVEGPWEQDGEYYWVRNTDSGKLSRLDVIPTMKTPMPIMDFAHSATATNTMGIDVQFVPEQLKRGQIGMSVITKLATEREQYRKTYQGKEPEGNDDALRILLIDGETLEVSAPSNELQTYSLSKRISDKLMVDSTLSLLVEKEPTTGKLILNISASDEIQRIPLALDDEMVKQVTLDKMSILAQNNNHKISPKLPTPYTTKAVKGSPNPWGINDWQTLYQLFSTCEDFSALIPTCHEQVKTLLELAKKSDPIHMSQQLALTTDSWLQLLSANNNESHNDAIQSLFGISAKIDFNKQQPYLFATYHYGQAAHLSSKVTYRDANHNAIKQDTVETRLSKSNVKTPLSVPANAEEMMIESHIQVGNLSLVNKITQPTTRFDGVWLNSHAAVHDKNIRLDVSLTGPYSGETQGEIRVSYVPTSTSHAQIQTRLPVKIEPYEHKQWPLVVSIPNAFSEDDLLRIEAILEVDGEPVKLVKTARLKELM